MTVVKQRLNFFLNICILLSEMSNKKHGIFGFVLTAILIFSLVTVYAQEKTVVDPVLKFYYERAGSVFNGYDPLETGTSYSFLATSYYKRVNNDGSLGEIDSAVSEYYFSFGQLDSQKTIIQTAQKFDDLDFSIPNVFGKDYHYSFYPNDTGGAEIAIGFDRDSMETDIPVGLAILDRSRYTLNRLYLYYPSKERHKRFSRCLRFIEYEGLIFPDSVWIVGAKQGIFSTSHYRLETRIENIQIYR